MSAIADFVHSVGCGVVATISADGLPQAAHVGIAVLDDGTLIFNSRSDARKMHNIRGQCHVAVVVGGERGVTVQMEGMATETQGEDRTRYGAEYERQFPGSRALASGFSVVAVRPRWVRVYDTASGPPSLAEAKW